MRATADATAGSRGSLALSLALVLALGAPAWRSARAEPASAQRLDGFNVVATPAYPFGSEAARISLANAMRLGARTVALIPFFWQASPASAKLVRGDDVTDAQLRAAIGDAHALGLSVVVKPHVWVPDSWAGAIALNSEQDWRQWFADYRRELMRVARIAAEAKADALAIGTELSHTAQRPEWNDLIGAARANYSGPLYYFAHNVEEAETVPFWSQLDAVGVTLYPPLGPDCARERRRGIMRAVAGRLTALAERTGKTIIVGEVGLRSAEGAAAKPWESAEERVSAPDPALQAAVIRDWLAALDRPAITGVLIWRWFTDPAAGGLSDTDFTVQGKPAERVLKCAWTRRCEENQAGVEMP